MRIRNQEAYDRLYKYVDKLMCETINEEGWSWLDGAMDPEVRADRLDGLRGYIREARRSDKKLRGLSARKRWLEMAYDRSVRRYIQQRQEHEAEQGDYEDDDLLD